MKKQALLFFALLISGFEIRAEDAPLIPLHITIISERPEAVAVFTQENFNWIANTLSDEFKSGDGENLVRFELKKITTLAETETANSAIFGIENHNDFNKRIKEIIKTPMFQKDMFNIYIYHNEKGNMLSNGGIYCYRKTVAGTPQEDCYARVLLHWKAVAKKNKLVLLHESGHALGLSHVTFANSDKKSPENNVMAADGNPTPKPLPPGESGYYFTPSQVATIKAKVQTLLSTFARIAEGTPLVGL